MEKKEFKKKLSLKSLVVKELEKNDLVKIKGGYTVSCSECACGNGAQQTSENFFSHVNKN
jgi:natural product precursor